jgi:hypothetical protein
MDDEEQKVQMLMRAYPQLDRMLCETLLRTDAKLLAELCSAEREERPPPEIHPITIE